MAELSSELALEDDKQGYARNLKKKAAAKQRKLADADNAFGRNFKPDTFPPIPPSPRAIGKGGGKGTKIPGEEYAKISALPHQNTLCGCGVLFVCVCVVCV